MEKKETSRNASRPCGSGKKYRQCCYMKGRKIIPAAKKDVTPTIDEDTTITRSVTSLDSIPTHNRNGLKPDVTKEQMMDLCLDEIHTTLKSEKVGMLAGLVNSTARNMDMVPAFTYMEIGGRMECDGRFEIASMQVCSLKGTEPINLIGGNNLNQLWLKYLNKDTEDTLDVATVSIRGSNE